jgi:hypothetical protein
MPMRTFSFAALACVLAAGSALAAPKELTLAVTGDNWGEIAPCG